MLKSIILFHCYHFGARVRDRSIDVSHCAPVLRRDFQEVDAESEPGADDGVEGKICVDVYVPPAEVANSGQHLVEGCLLLLSYFDYRHRTANAGSYLMGQFYYKNHT